MDISNGRIETRFMVFEKMTDGHHGEWAIFNRKNNDLLGSVEWYVPWRQYCYMPEAETVMNRDCLEKINELLAALNQAVKEATG